MLTGFLCALGAGLVWGLVFVAPLMLVDYPGVLLSFARYTGFGLIALVPALLGRRRIAALSKRDWIAAARLSMVGNLVYYAALASAIQLAGVPLPAMLIGTLPVVLSICANLAPGPASGAVPWRQLAPPLGIILAGLLLVNAGELARLEARTPGEYALGCLFALAALAAWTWYPIMNARHLKAHPQIGASTWATAQGLATLPLALGSFLAYGFYLHGHDGRFAFPLGPRPLPFVALMLGLGLCASWLGTVLWNHASQRLPTSLSGQLIVFETLAALLYGFLWRAALPAPPVLAGVVLLCAGVIWSMRVFRRVSQTRPGANDAGHRG